MNNLPAHIREELSKLSQAQILKFHELLSWSTAYGVAGCKIDPITCYKILDMVKNMGENPQQAIEPDKTINHDWQFFPKQKG